MRFTLWLVFLCIFRPCFADELAGPKLLGFVIYVASSGSMEPTVRRNEIVYVDTDAYRTAQPARGHIVAYRNAAFDGNIFIMRVVATAGDTIEIKDGALLINRVLVKEEYVQRQRAQFPFSRQFASFEVPPGAVFVLGDNRDGSNDSRFLGPVRMNDIVGHVTMAKESQFVGQFREVR